MSEFNLTKREDREFWTKQDVEELKKQSAEEIQELKESIKNNDTFSHKLFQGFEVVEELEKENETLKQQLSDVNKIIDNLKEWCVCGHSIDEHGIDNNPNLCTGCPCENPIPMWFRIIDIKELKSQIQTHPEKNDEKLQDREASENPPAISGSEPLDAPEDNYCIMCKKVRIDHPTKICARCWNSLTDEKRDEIWKKTFVKNEGVNNEKDI